MNVLFRVFLLVVSVGGTAGCAINDSPLRSKLIVLLEQEGKLVQKAVEQLKEHDIACTGQLPGAEGLFKDLQTSPLINYLQVIDHNLESITTARMPNKEHMPTLVMLYETAMLRLVRQMMVPMGEYYLERYAARKGQLVHAQKMWGDAGTKRYITSDDVLKSVAVDEFEIFDANVDKILACLYGDNQIFMACVLSKIRAELAAGYFESKNQEMTNVLFLNMVGFEQIKTLVLSPEYASIWTKARISGDTYAEDSEFLMPFAAAVSEVFVAVQANCVARIKALPVNPEDKNLIDECVCILDDKAIIFLRNTSRIAERFGGTISMPCAWQISLEIIKECLA